MTGQAVEIAASGAVVDAMIDYIYGGEPDITTADAMELFRLATGLFLLEGTWGNSWERCMMLYAFCFNQWIDWLKGKS